MLQLSESGVHTDEQWQSSDLLDRTNWHDLKLLSQIADAPSLRKASKILGISVNTVRARLARLESTLGTTLFARSRDGLKLTAEGREVLRVAKDMRLLGSALPAARGNRILTCDGEVRVCASEGLSAFWLTPRLHELRAMLPDYLVTLDSFTDQRQIAPVGYDVAVGFRMPEDQDAICARLATVHIMLFASDQYIRQHGLPECLDDLEGHKFIQQDSPGLHPDLINSFLTQDVVRQLVALRVNSSFSHYWAVVAGAGIGAMPTYARIITRRVRPVDLPVRLRFELWLSYKREARHSLPVQSVVKWLRASFDPVRYPWFSDRFVHPDNFVESHEDGLIIPLFDHLTGEH